MPEYKEITAEEAGMFRDMGTPFQILYDGDAVRYVWSDSRKSEWKPSHYPNDRFRIEVE